MIVAALDSTFQRKPFNDILGLVPLAENVTKLSAVCAHCRGDASFTKRVGTRDETVELIGGADMYVATCRACHDLDLPATPARADSATAAAAAVGLTAASIAGATPDASAVVCVVGGTRARGSAHPPPRKEPPRRRRRPRPRLGREARERDHADARQCWGEDARFDRGLAVDAGGVRGVRFARGWRFGVGGWGDGSEKSGGVGRRGERRRWR